MMQVRAIAWGVLTVTCLTASSPSASAQDDHGRDPMAKPPITDPGKNTPPIKPVRPATEKLPSTKLPTGKKGVNEITDPGTPTINPTGTSKIIRP